MDPAANPARTDGRPSVPTRRITRAGEGEVLGPPAGVRDRYLLDAKDWSGGAAVVEHLLAPSSIAAPVHRHRREDEVSYILEGQVHIQAGGEVVVAGAGDLVVKPRGEWHTFWNADTAPARVLEIIVPGGLEEAFRVMATDPDVDVVAVGAAYGVDVDLESTTALVERYGLTFG